MTKSFSNISMNGKRGYLKLKAERDEAVSKQEQLEVLFAEVCKERDWYKRCLESAEKALQYKDSVIDKISKKNKKCSKRLAEGKDVIVTLNKEISYQYKRREKAENYINALGQHLSELTKKVCVYDGNK